MFDREMPLSDFWRGLSANYGSADRRRHARIIRDGMKDGSFVIDRVHAYLTLPPVEYLTVPTVQYLDERERPPQPSTDHFQGVQYIFNAIPPPHKPILIVIPAPLESNHSDTDEEEDVSLPRSGPKLTPDCFAWLPHDEIYLGGHERFEVYQANKETEQVKASDPSNMDLGKA